MPLYEYKCTKCNRFFEKLQKFSDAPLTTCELCHETGGVERLLSTPSFHLKGGGWYKDGYSGSAGKNGGSEGKTETKPSESKSESKPESKPAASNTSTSSDSK